MKKEDKMIFDHSKLLGRMREMGIIQEELASQVRMNAGTLSSKLKSGTKFKQDEIIAVCNALNIDYQLIPVYFFTVKV